MNRRRDDILGSLDHDARIDQGVPPTAELPLERCSECPVDIADFTDDELAAHSRYHIEMAKEPKSIPSQSHLRIYRDDSKLSSSGWPLYWSGR